MEMWADPGRTNTLFSIGWQMMLAGVVGLGTLQAQDAGRLSATANADRVSPALMADRVVGSASSGTGLDSAVEPVAPVLHNVIRPDLNRQIYYKNKLEVSFETGWLPINIPFVFNFLTGSPYNRTTMNYTMNPNMLSLRWQLNNPSGPWMFRGNWEWSFTGSATIIPRGPETRYFAYDMGIRRYFVQRNWRVVPFFDGRLGIGDINAMGPRGVNLAQGQDLTFTVMLGSGIRFNVNPRTAFWGGVTYMHVSNAYLSEPRYWNYGINVYGPMVGIDYSLGRRNRRVARRPTPPNS